jgi:hypothetical protein
LHSQSLIYFQYLLKARTNHYTYKQPFFHHNKNEDSWLW